jgi:hypothetical protein
MLTYANEATARNVPPVQPADSKFLQFARNSGNLPPISPIKDTFSAK